MARSTFVLMMYASILYSGSILAIEKPEGSIEAESGCEKNRMEYMTDMEGIFADNRATTLYAKKRINHWAENGWSLKEVVPVVTDVRRFLLFIFERPVTGCDQ